MSPFPLNIGISILCRQADGICSVFMMLLNNLHRIFIPKLPIHFHASAGISSAPTAFPLFIPLRAVSVSSSLMFSVIAWLGSLSSVPTLWFSLFISKLKYWPHRSLISSSFIKTSPVALLTLRIWHMSLPDRSLAAAIRYMSCCPSTVSSWSYSPSIASALTLATTIFAFPFAVLYSTLSFSSPVLFQIFSLSFFSLTALSVSSFHHQLSSHFLLTRWSST